MHFVTRLVDRQTNKQTHTHTESSTRPGPLKRSAKNKQAVIQTEAGEIYTSRDTAWSSAIYTVVP